MLSYNVVKPKRSDAVPLSEALTLLAEPLSYRRRREIWWSQKSVVVQQVEFVMMRFRKKGTIPDRPRRVPSDQCFREVQKNLLLCSWWLVDKQQHNKVPRTISGRQPQQQHLFISSPVSSSSCSAALRVRSFGHQPDLSIRVVASVRRFQLNSAGG